MLACNASMIYDASDIAPIVVCRNTNIDSEVEVDSTHRTVVALALKVICFERYRYRYNTILLYYTTEPH